MAIRAVLFDMDGTLVDSGIDWLALREEIGLPYDGRPILEQLERSTPEVRGRGRAVLHRAEREGADRARLLPGAAELVAMLQTREVHCALITNNSRASAETVLSRHPLSFDLVLTREDGAAKPDPCIFIRALRQLDVSPKEAAAIGDAHLDVIAAHRSGIERIIAVGMAPWMAEHVSPEIDYAHVADLQEAHTLLAGMLDD